MAPDSAGGDGPALAEDGGTRGRSPAAEQSSAGRNAADQAAADQAGADRSAAGRNAADQASADRSAEGRLERAALLYERAVFGGDDGALMAADRELDAVEADLALARGRNIHTRFLAERDLDPAQAAEDPAELELFERALALYQALGDVGGEAEALFRIGCFYQLVRRDDATALPLLEQSLSLATQAGAEPTISEALRHLGVADHRAGRLDSARARLEESNRMRQAAGQLAGVATNLVGLAYVAAAQGRPEDADSCLTEATALATQTGAHRILDHITEARSNLG
jgi:tetratricopeptide (TPR) repeat protein